MSDYIPDLAAQCSENFNDTVQSVPQTLNIITEHPRLKELMVEKISINVDLNCVELFNGEDIEQTINIIVPELEEVFKEQPTIELEQIKSKRYQYNTFKMSFWFESNSIRVIIHIQEHEIANMIQAHLQEKRKALKEYVESLK